MSVLVVVRRRARPGQEQALIEAMTAEVQSTRPPRSSRTRVFQAISDPRTALYIAEWSSREAHLTYNSPPLVALDDLCTSPARRWYCQALDLYEAGSAPPQALSLTTLQCQPSAALSLITYLMEHSGPAIYQQPGIALRALYQDLDHPNRIVSVRGWRSVADLETARLHLMPEVDTAMRALGVRVERFTGVLRVARENRDGA
jgi:quinol monooxygenase YgiN